MTEINREQWFIGLAVYVSQRSRDTRSKFGAVIAGPDHVIRAVGWNDFPRGVIDDLHPERREDPLKYVWTEHAERNAIYNAARTGVSTVGCTMYINSTPCCDCARAIVQAGIKRLVCEPPSWDPATAEGWRALVPHGMKMMSEAGVQVDYSYYEK